jgi:hypothetical protein
LPTAASATGDGRIENDLKFFSGASNYLKKLKGAVTLETGLKTTVVRFDNDNRYFRGSNGTRQPDNLRTGAYNYSENINAAYLQVSKTLGTVVLKAGTRMEKNQHAGKSTCSPRHVIFH